MAIFTAIDIGKGGTGLRVYRSADGGRTWGDQFLSMGKGHDHQTLVLDATKGMFAGSIYLVSTVLSRNEAGGLRSKVVVARSSDDGVTFAEQSRFLPSNLNLQAANAVVLADGTVAVAFSDHHRITGGPRLIRPRDWLILSKDGGKTFSEPLLITEIGGGLGWPMLAAAVAASPASERIFWLTGGDTKEKAPGVFIQLSDDRGETWNAPVRVDQGNAGDADAQIPSVAVNRDGVVAVTWFDKRHDAGGQCYDLFFAASLNGGKTFRPEVRVSGKSSCPDTPRNKGAMQRWKYGGDYKGLVAAPDGTFHAVWPDSRDGIFQLRTAQFKVTLAR